MSLIYKSLMGLTGRKDIFPFYHLVTDHAPSHIKHLYPTRTINEFERDLDFLLKYYEAVSLQDYLDKKKTTKPKVVFSFDDGLREVYDQVAPIFQKKGIPGLTFINSDFVDNQALFYRYKVSILLEHFHQKGIHNRDQELLSITHANASQLDDISSKENVNFKDYMQSQQPYMTLEQLTDLKENYDFTIGAHSVDHPEYQHISIEEQIRQTQQSVSFVNHHFPNQLNVFAFPFTDFGVSDAFFEKLADQKNVDYTFGTAGMKNEPIHNHIQRIPMEGNGNSAQTCLQKEMIGYLAKGLIGKRKVKR